MTNQDAHAEYAEVSMTSLRIKPGTLLHVQNVKNESETSKVKFISVIVGKSVFIGMPEVTVKNSHLQIGEQYLVRGFDGQSDFSFTANVAQLQDDPFPHSHLTYPETAKTRTVRNDFRVTAAIPATALTSGESNPVPVTIKDMSVKGAMMEAHSTFGGVNTHVDLSFSVSFDNELENLKLPVIIRHVEGPDTGGGYKLGLEFEDLARDVKLVLNYLVFRLGYES